MSRTHVHMRELDKMIPESWWFQVHSFFVSQKQPLIYTSTLLTVHFSTMHLEYEVWLHSCKRRSRVFSEKSNKCVRVCTLYMTECQHGVSVTHAGQLQPSEQSTGSPTVHPRQSRSMVYKLRKLVCGEIWFGLVKQDTNDSCSAKAVPQAGKKRAAREWRATEYSHRSEVGGVSDHDKTKW